MKHTILAGMVFENRNRWLIGAAALMAVCFLAHLFAGGAEVIDPLRASAVPDVPKAVLLVVWHMATLLLAVLTWALWHLSAHDNRALCGVVAVLSLGAAGLFIAYGVLMLGSLWPMPQWIAFLVVAALMAVGMRRS